MSKINPCNTSILLCEEVVNIIRALLEIVFSEVLSSQISKFFTPTIHFEVFFLLQGRGQRLDGLFDELLWG